MFTGLFGNLKELILLSSTCNISSTIYVFGSYIPIESLDIMLIHERKNPRLWI
jgi:hypothetical protein